MDMIRSIAVSLPIHAWIGIAILAVAIPYACWWIYAIFAEREKSK